MANERRIDRRRAVLYGAPLLYVVLGLIHPNDLEVGDATGLWIGIHVGQLFLIWGLAYALTLLVEGVENRAARVARALILPFAIAYSAFDAVAGIAMGVIVREANGQPLADQAAATRLVNAFQDNWIGGPLYFFAGLLWLAAALAVVAALRRIAPRPALVLMGIGAIAFAVGHPQPPGPIGMACLIAGVAWFELRPRTADAPEPIPTEAQPTT